MNAITVKSGRLHRGSVAAAGYDLFADTAATIWPQQRVLIGTGVRLEMRPGFCGRICDRSGLASRSGLTVIGGVVDSDYRDEVRVVLLNTGSAPVFIERGSRCAQLLFVPVSHDVAVDGDAEVTVGGDRDGGFGSSGV